VDCFSVGSEPTIASPVPAATIAIAARYSILMVMVPPSAPRTNRILSEMVPGRCLTLALERLLARRSEGILVEPRSVPRSKFLNAPARCSNCFLFPYERRHDQNSGNESSGQDIRSTRPSLAVNYTAHVADSQRSYCRARCSQKVALARIAKSGGLQFRSEIASCARKRETCGRGGRQCWRFCYPNEASLCETALR
jgi:hypothetical protein